MNWTALSVAAVDIAKKLAIPVVLIVVLILVPSGRTWLVAELQAHPLRGAAIMAAICFLIAYMIGRRRGPVAARSGVFHDAAVISSVVLVMLGFGFFLTRAATYLPPKELKDSALQTSILWASACFMVGFLGGFLFGVPKVADDGAAAAAPGAAAAPRNGNRFSQRPNTNLEQISDWLTKIIVGLGLVELRAVPEHLKRASSWIARTLSSANPPSATAVSFAGSILVYFTILGFLAGYLLTLLFLAGAFGRAGQQAYGASAAFGDDDLSDRIRAYWRPKDGPPDAKNSRTLTDWIAKNLPAGTRIPELIATKGLEDARKKVVADLSIP
jgi:hypothetical protein